MYIFSLSTPLNKPLNILRRQHSELLLEASAKVLRIIKAHCIGKLRHTNRVSFFFHNPAGGFQTYVTDKGGSIEPR